MCHENGEETEHLFYEERQRKLGLFSLEKVRGGHKYLMERSEKERARLFLVPTDKTRGTGHKLKQRKI